jgi:hypothetical protein
MTVWFGLTIEARKIIIEQRELFRIESGWKIVGDNSCWKLANPL